jgi:maltooligosyltrehalose trehalohydrolase
MTAAVPWRLGRGASVRPDGGASFALWAPAATQIAVRFPADGTEAPLARRNQGIFEATVERVPPGTDYHYRVDGRDLPDPVSRHQPAGVHGPSRVVDPGAFRWTDADWRGLTMAELVLYELHVGTFTSAGTFDAVVPYLGGLRELGVTALELMPVAEFPGARNWGYDGVALYAPQSTYGGPEGLRRLVDAAHGAGLGVILDVVYNHLGPEGNYLGAFGPYFTDRYRTPWGAALNLDGPESDEVRAYFVDNARYWVTEFHLDGLRLDAVHAIVDTSAVSILAELAAAVHAQAEALGRRVVVIAESDLNDPRLVRAPERGGHGLDGQWSDDFHHAVHAALTGERTGYYVDFGGVAPIAKALRDRQVYDGQRSIYRRRRHGAPATDVPRERFVVCAQNHDQVGNRALGERLAALVPFPACKLAAALLLLSPYVPLLFMGEEYGETNPFLYFTSYGDPALAEAVREGRRQEFARFAWSGEVPDPQAESTFTRSRLERARANEPEHAALLVLYRDLLALRRQCAALRPGAAEVTVAAGATAEWVAWMLTRPATPGLLAACNLGAQPVEVALAEAGARRWRLELSTDDPRYGGAGGVLPARLAGGSLPLSARAAAVYLEADERAGLAR